MKAGCRAILGLLVVASLAGCSVTRQEITGETPEHLVSVRIAGTKIDKVPSTVFVVARDPAQSSARLQAMGGQEDLIENLVDFGNTGIWFLTEEYCRKDLGIPLSHGDVIYDFGRIPETRRRREEFARKYALVYVCEMKDPFESKERVSYLYRASDGFFVRLSNIAGPRYICPFHHWLQREKPGRCPVCEMRLMLADE
jgi:hypothetical protein